MRTSLPCTFLLILALAPTTQAQNIPNGGFEDWTNTGNYIDPTGWRTSNMVSYYVDGSLTCEQGSPGAVGDHFVKVTDRYLDGMGMQAANISTGATGEVFPGFPFTLRPDALNGMWQYHPLGVGHDGVVAGVLTRWNPDLHQREVIANAPMHAPGPITSWQSFSVPFLYYSDLDPDTAYVTIAASQNTTEDGTSIWVDDLSFGDAQGVQEQTAPAFFDLSPSPVTDQLHIVARGALAEVIIVDMSGRAMSRSAFTQASATLDVTALPAGMYMARVRLADGLTAARMFVRN